MFLKDTTIKIPTSDRIIRTHNKIIKTTVINNDNDDKDSLHNNNFDNINKKIVMIIIMSIIMRLTMTSWHFKCFSNGIMA